LKSARLIVCFAFFLLLGAAIAAPSVGNAASLLGLPAREGKAAPSSAASSAFGTVHTMATETKGTELVYEAGAVRHFSSP